jgi:hypothetical protein
MDAKDWRSDSVAAAIRQLEALERSATVLLSWQVSLVERQRVLVGAIGRILELLRASKGEAPLGAPDNSSSHCGRARRHFVLGGHGLTLSPLLAALFAALVPGTWQSAAALTEGIQRATGRRLTRRALVQGIYRLRHELLACGVKFRIEHNRFMGWRLGIKIPKESDT